MLPPSTWFSPRQLGGEALIAPGTARSPVSADMPIPDQPGDPGTGTGRPPAGGWGAVARRGAPAPRRGSEAPTRPGVPLCRMNHRSAPMRTRYAAVTGIEVPTTTLTGLLYRHPQPEFSTMGTDPTSVRGRLRLRCPGIPDRPPRVVAGASAWLPHGGSHHRAAIGSRCWFGGHDESVVLPMEVQLTPGLAGRGRHIPFRSTPMELTSTTTVTSRPEEVYAFWRQLDRLPTFMAHLEEV